MVDNKTFQSNVISGELLNIPVEFASLHDVERGDLLEVEVVRHKKDGRMVYERDAEAET